MNKETYINYDLPIDCNHRLYRVCMNNNHREFMAKHANCKFCCPQCHDEYHNLHKEKITSKELAVQINPANVEPRPNFEPKSVVFDRAIELFKRLDIDTFNGTKYNLIELYQMGFNSLSCYVQKFPSYKDDRNYMLFGQFKVFFINPWQVLIIDMEKQKQQIQEIKANNMLALFFPPEWFVD